MKKSKKNILRQVSVFLEFDRELREIVGTEREKIIVSEGTPIFMVIQAVLETYPQIISKFALSSLSFSINGQAPRTDSTLSANDIVTLQVSDLDSETFDIYFNGYRH
jgi:hypothetical protein